MREEGNEKDREGWRKNGAGDTEKRKIGMH